ncbi:Uncharacterised protein [Vibrio cholerae]|nr:Uncharacterised protein [Vibrio cholerae]
MLLLAQQPQSLDSSASQIGHQDQLPRQRSPLCRSLSTNL